MPSAATIEAQKAIDKARLATAFEGWQSQREIKLLLSILPPCETETQKEVMQGLLRSCFDAGSNAGAGNLAATLFEEMLGKRRDGRG